MVFEKRAPFLKLLEAGVEKKGSDGFGLQFSLEKTLGTEWVCAEEI